MGVKQTFEIASCGFTFGGIAEFRRQVAWADIVHYHFPWPFADLLHSMAGRPHCSVMTYHSDIVRQKSLLFMYRPLMHHFLSRVSRIVATSPNYFATSDVLSRFSDKVYVIPIGIQSDSYPELPEDSPVLQELELTMYTGSSRPISSADACNTDSCGCVATHVTSNALLHFPARSGDSVGGA